MNDPLPSYSLLYVKPIWPKVIGYFIFGIHKMKDAKSKESIDAKGKPGNRVKAVGSPKNEGLPIKSASNIQSSGRLAGWKSDKQHKPKQTDVFDPDSLSKSLILDSQNHEQDPTQFQKSNSTIQEKPSVKKQTKKAFSKPTSPKNMFGSTKFAQKKSSKQIFTAVVCKNCEQFEKKQKQLLSKIQQISAKYEKQAKERQITISKLMTENDQMGKKLEKFDSLKAENRKLIKDKTDKFNEANHELNLKLQVNQLTERVQALEKQKQDFISQMSQNNQLSLQIQSQFSQQSLQLVGQDEGFDKIPSSRVQQNLQTIHQHPLKISQRLQNKSEIVQKEANNNNFVHLAEKLQQSEETVKRLERQKKLLQSNHQFSENKINSWVQQVRQKSEENSELREKVKTMEAKINDMKFNESSSVLSGSSSSISLADFKKSRINYQSKIDRIKAISEHQFEIIQQMKQSSKIALSELEETSSILV